MSLNFLPSIYFKIHVYVVLRAYLFYNLKPLNHFSEAKLVSIMIYNLSIVDPKLNEFVSHLAS